MQIKDENRRMAARLNELDDTMSLLQAKMKYAGTHIAVKAAGESKNLAYGRIRAVAKKAAWF